MKIYREMNSDELKGTILNTFKWVRSYTILACQSGGHSLVVNDDQHLNGEELVKRRGPLYLAIEDSEDYVVSMNCELIHYKFTVFLTISTHYLKVMVVLLVCYHTPH